ncbi:magnesium transporter CorA family protein [Williamsia sp. DF01-3]|uniref:magnesium transporter CorA family protein n=1 Tax=Williamsia sp. DF01-3 TaxID=2934157 RepID=UPI001FF1D011|nr:magnesium transporter CorA family protein [Williamsia sp. DF01-3]MCK0516650.1 magnesium transporter CorA family protein [Williamsia sp. DF01-3]
MSQPARVGSDWHDGSVIDKVNGRVWVHGELQPHFDLEMVSDCLGDTSRLVWVDLVDPTHEALSKLAAEIDLNTWAVEDALADAERVKATAYPTHRFVTVYAVHVDDNPTSGAGAALHSDRISLFIKHNVLITVRLSDHFDMSEVIDRWDEMGGQQYGIGALIHGLLDVVVDGHFAAVQRLDDGIEDLETLLFDDKYNSRVLQQQTYQLRKDLVSLRRVVMPMREVVAMIQRSRLENNAPTELDPNFSDLYDHVLRVTEWTESLRDMVTTLFETNLSLQDARLNTVMKKLTGWAAIIAVPTAVTGFYGQNIPYPGFDHYSGFISSTVVIIVAVLALYILFKKRDWL